MANRFRWPSSWRERISIVFLGCVVFFGGCSGGMRVSEWIKDRIAYGGSIFTPGPQYRWSSNVPSSKQPGPPRTEPLEFALDATNALRMNGIDDVRNERWCDAMGHYYTRKFAANYSNQKAQVMLQIDPRAPKLKGRLEAKGLKPNFAYQIKLLGDFRDRRGFEAIGRIGRWRLPGIETNYTDADYEDYPEEKKSDVEAYLFFDYFVTDARGCAVREFELDSSLHVLWRLSQSDTGILETDVTELTLDISNPLVYSNPGIEPVTIRIWAERELARYETADQEIGLPPGNYQAYMILTEESFHATGVDGGWWATIAKVPIQFEITQEQ